MTSQEMTTKQETSTVIRETDEQKDLSIKFQGMNLGASKKSSQAGRKTDLMDEGMTRTSTVSGTQSMGGEVQQTMGGSGGFRTIPMAMDMRMNNIAGQNINLMNPMNPVSSNGQPRMNGTHRSSHNGYNRHSNMMHSRFRKAEEVEVVDIDKIRQLQDIDPHTEEFPDECALFIGDLSRSVNEDLMEEVFSKYGDIDSVDIKRDRVTKNNLGYGFVKFKSREFAEAAKRRLHGTEIGGRTIRIGWAQKNTNLFVGDLDPRIDSDHLKEIFRNFGPIYDEDTFVKRNKYGFVKFKHRAHAEKAKAALDNKYLTIPGTKERTERPIRIGWGDANTQRNCVHVQFDNGYATTVDLNEQDFRQVFERFGRVVKVSLPRFMDRQLKGYGFIHFEENDAGEESAARAITTLSNDKIKGVTIQCNFGKRQNQRHKRYSKQHRNPHADQGEYMNQNDDYGNHNQRYDPNPPPYQQQMQAPNPFAAANFGNVSPVHFTSSMPQFNPYTIGLQPQPLPSLPRAQFGLGNPLHDLGPSSLTNSPNMQPLIPPVVPPVALPGRGIPPPMLYQNAKPFSGVELSPQFASKPPGSPTPPQLSPPNTFTTLPTMPGVPSPGLPLHLPSAPLVPQSVNLPTDPRTNLLPSLQQHNMGLLASQIGSQQVGKQVPSLPTHQLQAGGKTGGLMNGSQTIPPNLLAQLPTLGIPTQHNLNFNLSAPQISPTMQPVNFQQPTGLQTEFQTNYQ